MCVTSQILYYTDFLMSMNITDFIIFYYYLFSTRFNHISFLFFFLFILSLNAEVKCYNAKRLPQRFQTELNCLFGSCMRHVQYFCSYDHGSYNFCYNIIHSSSSKIVLATQQNSMEIITVVRCKI